LIFVDEVGLGEKLAGSLLAGQAVTRVIAGQSYGKIDETTFAINPELPGDYEALLAELCRQNKTPQKVLHLWSLSAPTENIQDPKRLERSQRLGLHSLLFLARALGAQNITSKLEIEVVSNNIHAVTGEETLYPEKATILGACKVIPVEYPNFRCRHLDITIPQPGTPSEQRILAQLRTELTNEPAEQMVAYRGGFRWVEGFEQVHLEAVTGVASRLKTGGVYLITGGLGGIGLALAEFLATSVKAKLILLGRSALPPAEKWADWLATHDHQDETSFRIRKIQLLRTAGAETLILSADVADRERMREVIALAQDQFGHIEGVIHAAGSADYGGVIQRRTKESTAEILSAKVKGLLVIKELLADSGLDFLVLCSSVSSLSANSAVGQVGYAAANEFLDAFASYMRSLGTVFTVAINWDTWREVGMAVRAIKEQAQHEKTTRVLTVENSLSPQEGAAIFNRILGCDFHRIVVSVADLAVRRQRGMLGAEQPTGTNREAEGRQTTHERPDLGIAFLAPTSEAEQVLADLWQKLLGFQVVGVDDNFFDLGGDSLLLLQLQAKIRQKFGVDLALAEMFQNPTISSLAVRITQPLPVAPGLDAIQDRGQMQRAAFAHRSPKGPSSEVK
jgi:NAD(P)-dependent dehydrogenase (short-subunit alcohol dehydrogenase family)/aryl carrier-like protein